MSGHVGQQLDQPHAGDQDKYLKGDGTWATLPVMGGASTTASGSSGLVPQPYIADKDKYLKGDGTWASIEMPSVFTGATASTAGTVGTVKAPLAGEQAKFLCGDGNWERVTQLDNYYTTRPTTANVSLTGGLNYFLATSSMTTGKPPADSHIIHTSWDNNNTGLGVQLALAHGNNPRMWIRSQNSGTWTGWYMVALQNTTAALTTDRVVVTKTNGKLNVSTVTTSELEYLSGVTSAVQTQIDGKSTVSLNPTVSAGTKIAELTIDGTTQNLYAPTNSGGSLSVDTLWNGSDTPTTVTTKALSNPYTDYDVLVVEGTDNTNNVNINMWVLTTSIVAESKYSNGSGIAFVPRTSTGLIDLYACSGFNTTYTAIRGLKF